MVNSFLDYSLVLASGSPRRKELLAKTNIPFRVASVDTEESYPDKLPTEEVAEYLAIKKAKAAAHLLEVNEILLAADTVVILDDQIYGKPKNREEAISTLVKLSNRSHLVQTGVCLLNESKMISFSQNSEVHFDKLDIKEIEYYVDQYEPYDKAGSYALQEWIGFCKVNHISGVYDNIVGLPVQKVYENLRKHF